MRSLLCFGFINLLVISGITLDGGCFGYALDTHSGGR